ncbi:hypothetical protein NDA10_007827 [Ustilago hordei]|uniref:Uncharacterized protein n=1 Tax=Ustilago hordei TaxID=120017 RepID=I2G4V5_USTHO|nr:uncharacterized protein UHO2_01349 [Ustilago hordei]KAJ1044661.1 hypothetical protein NDA10_007827 [Ustilago hordei]KAJ1583061.1 hypothetical protein NDA15_000118 [Ustilago hordei]KAJ1592226.1 hypothetical protein NDA12_006668 [Ustilago hordei]CCF54198.1 uncharacterized protein UHOR_00704 [Ustilago hordei]SYW74483.1 uncharacterized protein UHO2_01349 [Ustilago hordei]
MTQHPPAAHASSSRDHSTVGQSLADLYNARHAEERGGPSTSKAITSNSLADLYNKRHEDECRKKQTSSSSFVDLYNQVYEHEQQYEDKILVQESSFSGTGHLAIAGPSRSSTAGVSKNLAPPQALFINDSDEDTPEPPSLLPSEPDNGDEEDKNDDDEIAFRSPPMTDSRDGSRSRSESMLPVGPQVVYVARTSVPRRGALGDSATRLTMDSDDGSDAPGTPEPELPTASRTRSNAPLARPHPSPSKPIVQSSSSRNTDLESEHSSGPFGPHNHKGKAVQRLLESTQEDDSLNSLLISGSAPPREDRAALARVFQPDAGSSEAQDVHNSNTWPSDDIVIISDSEQDGTSTRQISPQHSEEDRLRALASRSGSEGLDSIGRNTVVVLPSSARRTEKLAEDRSSVEASASGSAERSQLSQRRHSTGAQGAQMRPVLNAGADSDVESDTPIVTDARIVEVRATDSSAKATPGNAFDSDFQRRYPKRARNVADYNVKRIFERYERAQSADAAPPPPSKPKKQPLPVVNASPAFFDALRSKTANKVPGGSVPSSFVDFLQGKINSGAATAALRAAALSGSAVTMPPKFTEAEAKAVADKPIPSTALWNVSIRTDDRASLWQLKPSTRRWLGVTNPGHSDPNADGATTPTLPAGEKGPALNLKLRDIIASHTGPPPNPADLRDDLQRFEGAGLIGRPKDAEYLESASRRLRLGRAYKLPLPDTLSAFVDMEHKEWVRAEEDLPEMARLAEDWKAREEGKITVEVENSDCIQSHYDHAGRKTVSRIRPETGGEIRMYFDLKQSEAAGPQEESQNYRIVRRESPRKSPSLSRLSSSQVARDPSDAEADSDVEMRSGEDGTPSPTAGPSRLGMGADESMAERSESPVSVMEVDAPASPSKRTEAVLAVSAAEPKTRPAIALAAAKISKSLPNAVRASSPKSKPQPSKSSAPPKNPAAIQPKPKIATASKGTARNLLSYLSTQISAPQPAKPAKVSKSVPAPATTSTSVKSSTIKPTVSASAKAEGKARARDIIDLDDFEFFPHSSLGSGSQVFVDLTHSSSASESIAERPLSKKVRSSSPVVSTSSKRAAKVERLQVEEEEEEVSFWNTEDEAELNAELRTNGVTVGLPATPTKAKGKTVKRKHAANRMRADSDSDSPSPALAPAAVARKALKTMHPSTAAQVAATAFRSPNKAGASSSSKCVGGEEVELPAATPSPTRNGWKGITGWYSDTRDAFSPTPDDRPRKGDKEKQARLDQILQRRGKEGKHKHR